MYAITTIRRFSSYTKKEEIEQYVESHYKSIDDDQFINGKEVSLMTLIYRGVAFFSEKRKSLKKKQGSQSPSSSYKEVIKRSYSKPWSMQKSSELISLRQQYSK